MFGATTYLLLSVAALVYFVAKKYLSRKDPFWVGRSVEVKSMYSTDIASWFEQLTFKKSITEINRAMYTKMGDVKFGVFIEAGNPSFVVKDLDLIKRILVKDFDHFVDRRDFSFNTSNRSDKVFGRVMTLLKGKEWKDLRSVMGPTFSTGRIRRMFSLFNACGRDLVKFIQDTSTKSVDNTTIDFQDCFGRYTMTTIASIGFGIQTDSFTKEESEFRKMGQRLNSFSFYRFLKFLLFFAVPKLVKMLGLSMMDKQSTEFFTDIVENNIRERRAEEAEGKTNKRQDFLQIMLEAQAGQLKMDDKELDEYEKDALIEGESVSRKESAVVLDDLTIVAQSLLFFLAGADTIESVLTFTAYELALNPDVQERLAEEVKQCMEENQGDLTYDATHQMKYLDMVISETLRLYSPMFIAERKCTQDYTVPETNIVIPRGTLVAMSITGIHHDEKYYPDPCKFNPERFTPENKAKRHPYAYLPFGQGPRNCIAMRFALTEVKAAIAHLVYNFKIEPSRNTDIPMKYSKKAVTTPKPQNGMWLKFKTRDNMVNDTNL